MMMMGHPDRIDVRHANEMNGCIEKSLKTEIEILHGLLADEREETKRVTALVLGLDKNEETVKDCVLGELSREITRLNNLMIEKDREIAGLKDLLEGEYSNHDRDEYDHYWRQK